MIGIFGIHSICLREMWYNYVTSYILYTTYEYNGVLPLHAKVILIPRHSPEKVTVGAGGETKDGESFFKPRSLTIGAASASIAASIQFRKAEKLGWIVYVYGISR